MQLKSIQSILITRAVNAITFYKINASSYYKNQARKEMNQHPPLYQHVTITVSPNTAKQGAEQASDPETLAKESAPRKIFSPKDKILPSFF